MHALSPAAVMPHRAVAAMPAPAAAEALVEDDATPAAPPATGTAPTSGAAAPDAPPAAATPPDTVTDAQGRVYHRRVDDQTGHVVLEHRSEEYTPAGEHTRLAIEIDIAPDGSSRRTITQQLTGLSGEQRHERTVTDVGPDGRPRAQESEARSTTGTGSRTERTVTAYADGAPIRRETHVEQSEERLQPTGDRSERQTRIRAVWDDGGAPLTSESVPQLERTDIARYIAPGKGLHRDTDRVITTELRAVGTPGALTYPEPMKMTQRFEGRGDQYLEREISVPVDDNGAPQLARAEVVSTTDAQAAHVKALMQTRIWGGFASSLMTMGGFRMMRAGMPEAGKMLLYGSLAAGVAQGVGEGHALATRRNDASWPRMIMSAYDTAWRGLLVNYIRTPRAADVQVPGTGMPMSTAVYGASGLSMATHGADILTTLRNDPLRQPVPDLAPRAGINGLAAA